MFILFIFKNPLTGLCRYVDFIWFDSLLLFYIALYFYSFIEGFLVLILVGIITNFIIETIYHFILNKFDLTDIINQMSSNTSNNNLSNNSLPTNNPTYNPVQDPVRYWPSSTLVIPASFLTAYRLTPGGPRQKLGAGLAALGVVAPAAIFNAAIENPNGFNMLFHSYSEYRRTGSWPRLTHPQL